MTTLLFRWITLTCLLAAPAWAGYSHREAFSHRHAFAANGVLSVQNINGPVTIRTWDRPEVLVEGEKSAKTAEELALIDLMVNLADDSAAVKVRLPKQKNRIFGSTIRAAVSLTITIPSHVRVEQAETVNGDVKLQGLAGAVHARTVNGGIEAEDLRSNADCETVNGSVKASFAAVPTAQRISLATVNGGLTVLLPRDADLAVEGSVVNGHISCDLPLQQGRVERRSLRGQLGAGGSALRLETVNGSITIAAR